MRLSENFVDSILLVGWFKLRPNDLYVWFEHSSIFAEFRRLDVYTYERMCSLFVFTSLDLKRGLMQDIPIMQPGRRDHQ